MFRTFLMYTLASMFLCCTPFCAAGILVLNAREGGPAWRAGMPSCSGQS
jgi:hypothetical protein